MKKLLRLLCFICVLGIVYYFIDGAVRLKYPDGIEPMENLYDFDAGDIDVLFVGSSHVGMNVNCKQLWNDYGIAGYLLWGGMQPPWNSYYFIKEALKEQNPKLIVLEVYTAVLDEPYSDYSATVKNTMGMRPSLNKLSAVRDSASSSDLFYDILLGMPTYHNRFLSLTQADFENYFWMKKTQVQALEIDNDTTYPLDNPDWSEVTDMRPLAAKQEEFLLKTMDLCRAHNIPLMLIAAPYWQTEQEQQRYNRIAEIAEERELIFQNYNLSYRDAGIDFATDFRDQGHLNMDGIAKYTRHLAQIMKANYSIPDRRDDVNHPWNAALSAADSALYRLEEQFIGDGFGKFTDTGLKLYENPFGAWTLCTSIDTTALNSIDSVYLSCFSEDEALGNYGLLIRKAENGALSILAGNSINFEVREPDEILDIAISKQGFQYTIIVNGKVLADKVELQCESYPGTLLIGCEELPGGEKYRFGQTQVRCLEVYDRAYSKAELLAWTPEPAPLPAQMEAADVNYLMPEQFIGDGDLFVDTGIKLYQAANQSWALKARIVPSGEPGDKVYFSCFSEEENAYRGLMVRGQDSGEIDIHVGNNQVFKVIPGKEALELTVVKRAFEYDIYVDGKPVAEAVQAPCAQYGGSLLIGAQTMANGEIFRKSAVTVEALEIVEGEAPPETLDAWKLPLTPLPGKPEPTSVEYQLQTPFLGDGASRHVDTKMRLYDAPDKNWTMLLELARNETDDMQTVLSCFDETPGNYHGMLIRQQSAYEFAFVLGTDTITIAAPPDNRTVIAITKNGYDYEVFIGGESVGKVTSKCGAYAGALLLGCQETQEGELFRFSPVRIQRLELHDGVYTDAQITKWTNQSPNAWYERIR